MFDEQITDFFFRLAHPDNIHRYKSNLRWNDSDWKYLKDSVVDYGYYKKDKAIKTLKNIMLDYRIIVTDYSNFDFGWGCKLSDSCRDFLYDVMVIGENLGFDVHIDIPEKYQDIELSEWSNFDVYTKQGKLFCNVKLYKNGNKHIKFCKEFMQKLNIETARINGWIHDRSEAVKEFGFSEQDVAKAWQTNLKIEFVDGKRLLGLPDVGV